MCELITGKKFFLTPRYVWKVLRYDAVANSFNGPYYLFIPTALGVKKDSSWRQETLGCTIPEHNQNYTAGGFHVFFTEAAASTYLEECTWERFSYLHGFQSYTPQELKIVKMIAWGDALPFEGGAAVEFCILA